MNEKIEEKWAREICNKLIVGEKPREWIADYIANVAGFIKPAIDEATTEQQKRIAEMEKMSSDILREINNVSEYDKCMSHGEHMALAEEYNELLTEIVELVETRSTPPTENRPDSAEEGGEG